MKDRRMIIVLLMLLAPCLLALGTCTSAFTSPSTFFEFTVTRTFLLVAGTHYEFNATIYCLKLPDDCLLAIPESAAVKEPFIVSLQPDQAIALVKNEENLSKGYWPSTNHMIAYELAVVAGSESTPRLGSKPAMAWDVHVVVHAENIVVWTLIVVTNLVVIALCAAALLATTIIMRANIKQESQPLEKTAGQ